MLRAGPLLFRRLIWRYEDWLDEREEKRWREESNRDLALAIASYWDEIIGLNPEAMQGHA